MVLPFLSALAGAALKAGASTIGSNIAGSLFGSGNQASIGSNYPNYVQTGGGIGIAKSFAEPIFSAATGSSPFLYDLLQMALKKNKDQYPTVNNGRLNKGYED